MAAKKKVKRSPRTPEHPRFSILDEGEGYRVTLVDIGLPREAGKGKNPTNFGLGDWDGQILHLKTTDRMNTLELKRTKNWTIEQVRDLMSAYVSVFQSIGQTVEEYDFTEVSIDEIIQWEPISALPQWDTTVPSTDDGD